MTDRTGGRGPSQLRPTSITRDYLPHAEGSCLIEMGNTHVICTASIAHGVPRWLKGARAGLGDGRVRHAARAAPTSACVARRPERGQGGRTMEIQRLIGRTLRTVTDLFALGELTVTLDCDVIRADGGTRCAVDQRRRGGPVRRPRPPAPAQAPHAHPRRAR